MTIALKTFVGGIRIKPDSSFTSDPTSGKVGEMYWNVTRSVVRICISATPIWQDVFVHRNTINDSTLRWDVVADRWTENNDLRINSSSIYTPDDGASLPLSLSTGDSSTVAQNGSDITIKPGAGGSGANQGRLIIDLSEITGLPIAGGKPLSITAPENTTAGQYGSDISISGGVGVLGLGSITATGENETHNISKTFDLNSETADIEGTDRINLRSQQIGIKAQAATDPVIAEEGDIYYNTEFRRLKKYQGSRWEYWDVNDNHQNTTIIRAKDDILTTLPIIDTTLVDGIAVLDGDYAVFTNLSSNANRVYKASVDGGGNISWVSLALSTDASGDPTVGQFIFISAGSDNLDYLFVWNGTQWLNAGLFRGDTDDVLRWDGAQWASSEFIHSDGQKFYLKDNATADAVKSENFTIQASNKTAGTGDGGDLVISPGTSVGGVSGRTILEGDRVKIAAQSATTPSASEESDIYYDTVEKNILLKNDATWNRLDNSKITNNNQIMSVVGGGSLVWDSATNTISWSEDLFVQMSGSAVANNKVVAGSAVVSSDGTLLFASIDRTGATVSIPTNTALISTLGVDNNANENTVVIARRHNDDIYWGSGNDIKSTVNGGILTKKSLTNNTAGTVFAVDAAKNDAIVVKYSIKRGTNVEVGHFYITNDGTIAGLSGQGNALSPIGISFGAVINTTNVELTFLSDNSGLDAEIKYSVEKWIA